MNIFLSAGEASGDAYAAALVRQIRAVIPDATFSAIGGSSVRAEGAHMVADSSRWGAIGMFQSLKGIPVALLSLGKIKKFFRSRKGLFIPIDFGFGNKVFCRIAKKNGWQVLYFIPPGSWKRRPHGIGLEGLTDAIVTPFPWSETILKDMGLNAHFCGHPMKQLVSEMGPAPVRDERIAVLPGSRMHEIDNNLRVIAEAVKLGGYPLVEFAVSGNVDKTAFEAKWNSLSPNRSDIFTAGDVFGVLRRARAGIICSGTATLQAALCGCPMVVIYRLSKMMEVEAKIIRFKLGMISLPNIILDRWAVPELVQHSATAENIVARLAPLLVESPERLEQLRAFAEIDGLLGSPDCLTRTAELVRSMVRGHL